MATLWIVEYDNLGRDVGGSTVLTGNEPALNIQRIPISGSNNLSATFLPQTRFVELQPDVTCQVLFGDDPDVTNGGQRITANSAVFRALMKPGLRIAVIQSN